MKIKGLRAIALAAFAVAALTLCGCPQKKTDAKGDQSRQDYYGEEAAFETADGQTPDGSAYGGSVQGGLFPGGAGQESDASSEFIPNRTSELIRGYATENVFRDQGDGSTYLIVSGDRVIKEFPMFGKNQKMSIKRGNIEYIDEISHYGGALIRIYDATGNYMEFDAAAEDVKAIRGAIGR